MDLTTNRVRPPLSPDRVVGWGWRARGRLRRKDAACACAREGRKLSSRPQRSVRPTGQTVLPLPPTCRLPEGAEQVVSAALEAFGAIDILVNNVATAKGTDIVNTADDEWQEAFDQTLVSGHSHVAARRAAHAAARRRGHHHDCVDLGARVGRADGLQRREGRRDQPREGDGAAAGQRQHSRQQRRARIDPVSRRLVGQAAESRSGRDRRVHQARSFRSAASAAPKKSATPSRFSPRRARAGSAAHACQSTAASRARRSDESIVGTLDAESRTVRGRWALLQWRCSASSSGV